MKELPMFSRKSLTISLTREINPNPILSNKIHDIQDLECANLCPPGCRDVLFMFVDASYWRAELSSILPSLLNKCLAALSNNVWLSAYGLHTHTHTTGEPQIRNVSKCPCVLGPLQHLSSPQERHHGRNGKTQMPPLTLHNQT